MYSQHQIVFNTFNDNKVEKQLFVFIVSKDNTFFSGLFYELYPLHIAVQNKMTATRSKNFKKSASIRKKGELALIIHFITWFKQRQRIEKLWNVFKFI